MVQVLVVRLQRDKVTPCLEVFQVPVMNIFTSHILHLAEAYHG